ncbi:MAG: glycoside hydrolase family 5 protein [Lachnospiraceae bacterium]
MKKKGIRCIAMLMTIMLFITMMPVAYTKADTTNNQTPDQVIDQTADQEVVLDGSQPISPWEYQKLLGKGMDVDWCKTAQGMKYYSEKACKNFKASGVKHVRIRIKDTISDKLLTTLDKQVSDCLKNGLIPIIAYQADEFKNAPTEENIQKVVSWWNTVANCYKDTSYRLAFDLLIEATDALNKQPEKLNEIYERIVTEVRKTNPNRIIMISPRLRSDAAYLSELKIPTQHNGYLMAEWHFYASGPSKTNARKLWTTGTAAEKKLITDKIDLAVKWQKENNVPTWVGAWMAGNYNDGNDYTVSEQVKFATFMVQQLTKAGIPFAVNSDTKFYDRQKNVWIDSMRPLFQCIYGKKANGSTSSTSVKLKINKKVRVGFNAKGNLDTSDQYKYVAKQFASLKKSKLDTSKVYLRLQGGTISQKTYPKDWSDGKIALWSKLQKTYKCKYLFVVNLNDTASNQLKFYERLKKAGLSFCGIELGNEQYLPKFASSKYEKDSEVTKRTASMTPAKYIKLCNEYIKVMKKYKLPFYVQFAPKSDSNKKLYETWNTAMVNAINGKKFGYDKIYGTIHLYERDGAGSLDVKQIASLRKRIKRTFYIAVTESGVVDKKNTLSESAYAKQELELTKRILTQMQSGDMMLNQVLYTDYKTVGSAVLHPQKKGLTTKGKEILKLFKQYWTK